ncbi:MAG: hypothetical protein ABEI27_00895 [Halobellus sp.]|uniref:hypothetical protein n=1 Tax=Halobellus sp. TaxID=1979212 RepID=UPI0035D3DFBA
MTEEVSPPKLAIPEDWRLVSEERRMPFDVGVVSVRATTRIYEDDALRERLADATGAATTWRFVFASRLRIRPVTSPSRSLTRLITDRSNTRFRDVLRERGFDVIERADDHRIDVGDATTDATRYRARVRVEDLDIPVEGYFAVWPHDGTYLLGGGAYPLSLPDSEAFDPERGREELFSMLQSIR